MKLQQKLECSLDDIIQKEKKNPHVSQKSKGITRTGADKLKRLKQLNKKKPDQDNTRSDRGQKVVRCSGKIRFNPRSQDSAGKNNKNKPQRGGKKWTAPRRASRFNRNFRGRNRN